MDPLDLQVLLEGTVLLEPRERLDRSVHPDLRESEDRKAPKVPLASPSKDLLEMPARRVLPDRQAVLAGQEVWMAVARRSRDRRVNLATREIVARQVHEGIRDTMVLLDSKDRPAVMDPRASRETPDRLDRLA